MRTREIGEIEIFGKSLVKLHKVLSESDQLKAQNVRQYKGKREIVTPIIVVDFAHVTSVQVDYMRGGTVIMDPKTALIVVEPIEAVIDAWLEVKANLDA